MKGVTGGTLFGPGGMPYGVQGYGEKTTPNPVQLANGENALQNRSAYYWLGMVALIVVWRVIIASKGA